MKINMKIISILVIALVLAGCASREGIVVSSGKDYLAALSTLELDPDKYEWKEYHQVVFDRMDSWLESIHDSNELKTLFYQCQAKWKSQPEVPQDRLQWIDPSHESRNLIMYRLAGLKTPEAAKVMVDIYCDKTVGWDAHPSEMAADAIAGRSEFTLPILKEKQKSGADVAWLIKLLESGTKRIL